MKTKITFTLFFLFSITFQIFSQTDAEKYWIKEDLSQFSPIANWIIEETNYETYPNNVLLTTTYANIEASEYCAEAFNGNMLRIRGLKENGSAQFTVPNASKVTIRVTGKSNKLDRTVLIYRNDELVETYENVDRSVCKVFVDDINSEQPITYKITAGNEESTDPVVLYEVEVVKYGVTIEPEPEPEVNYDAYWIYEDFSKLENEADYVESSNYTSTPNDIVLGSIWSNIEPGEGCTGAVKILRISGKEGQEGSVEFTVPDAKSVKIGVTGKSTNKDREVLIYQNGTLIHTFTELDRTICEEFFDEINSEEPLTYKITGGNNAGKPVAISSIIVEKHNYTGIKKLNTTHLEIYPNPASDVVYIKTDNQKPALQAALYDMTGREVKLVSNAFQININNLVKGVYILKIITEENTFTRKLIKK
jgi:hypothetical protein